MPPASMSPIGVLLYNLGGPNSLEEVEPFLVRLFSDREIIQLPFGARAQPIFARLIAKARGPSVRRNYALIGGGSPQLRLTLAQAAALERRLNHAAPSPQALFNARGAPPPRALLLDSQTRSSQQPQALPPAPGAFPICSASADCGARRSREPEPARRDCSPRVRSARSGPREEPVPVHAANDRRWDDPYSRRGRAGMSAERVPGVRSPEAPAEQIGNAPPAPSVPRFQVFVGMRYARPSPDDALTAMAAAGVRRIVALTMFPHWSKATTGSWQTVFRAALAAPRWACHGFEVGDIDRYADDPLYLEAVAGTVRRGLAEFPPESRDRVVILFSAHGLPQRFVDTGDPYVDEIERTRRGVLERLHLPNPEQLGYQSRTGPVRWIGPGTEELIHELGASGVKDLLVVPLSFVSDHIETLYEVDILFAEVARRAGITRYRRAAALNTEPSFIETLARLVERHVDGEPEREPAPAEGMSYEL